MDKILRYLNNYFFRFKEVGEFEIVDNKLTGTKGQYLEGQYLLVEGSYLNDGVLEVLSVGENEIGLKKACSEKFKGVVYSLAIPNSLKELAKEIEEWEEDNKKTDIISESFEGYSYTKANVNGRVATWKDVFKEELKQYRSVSDGRRLVKELK